MKKIRIICLLLCLAVVLSSCSLLNRSSQDNSNKWTEDRSERSSRNSKEDEDEEEEEDPDSEEDRESSGEKPRGDSQESSREETRAEAIAVAFISDYGSFDDMAMNEAGYDACIAYCDRAGWDYYCAQPRSDTDESRAAEIEEAIDSGCQVIITNNYLFGSVLAELSYQYPDVTFIALDLHLVDCPEGFVIPSNLVLVKYSVEFGGFMAGYAAVKAGFKKLGFLGGMALVEVARYGYGFVQGADTAAKELGLSDVEVKYAYANQFYGDAEITNVMNSWYESGTQVIMSCGGGLFTSVAEAAYNYKGKIIGIDYDQKELIDSMYGESYQLTFTSAVKSMDASLRIILDAYSHGEFQKYGGLMIEFGTSSDPETSCVALAPSTDFSGSFTVNDYLQLLSDLSRGKYSVSSDVMKKASDFATVITVIDQGNLK